MTTYRQECYRKCFHLAALILPLMYAFLDRWVMLAGLVPLTLLVVWADKARHHSVQVGQWIHGVFGSLLREHEREAGKLSGSSHLFIAACLCILFFPKLVAITALSVMAVSDTAAALVGMRYGKRRFLDKTMEGTLAFIGSAIAVVFAVGLIGNVYHPVVWEFYVAGIMGAVISGYVEAVSKRLNIDDNFSIPLSMGGMMLVLGFLTGSYLGL